MYNSVMFMFIWYYYLHIIVYVSVTVLGTSDVVIKFYVIDICSQEPKKKIPEEETSPVP